MNDFASSVIQGLLTGMGQGFSERDRRQTLINQQEKERQDRIKAKQDEQNERIAKEQREREDRRKRFEKIEQAIYGNVPQAPQIPYAGTWNQISQQGQQGKTPDIKAIERLLLDPEINSDTGARSSLQQIHTRVKQDEERAQKDREEAEKLNKGKNIYTVLTQKGYAIPELESINPTDWKAGFKELTGEDPAKYGIDTPEKAKAAIKQAYPGGKRKLTPEEITALRGELATTSPQLLAELDRQIRAFEKPQFTRNITDKKTGQIYDQEYVVDYWTGEKRVTKPRINARPIESKNQYGFTVIDPKLKNQFNDDYIRINELIAELKAAEETGLIYDPGQRGYVAANQRNIDEAKKAIENEQIKAKRFLEQTMSKQANDAATAIYGATDDPTAVADSIKEAYKNGEINEIDFNYLLQWYRLTFNTELQNVR